MLIPLFSVTLQREWDLNKGGSHLNLIVSGSIYSMMHKLFEDSKEPLFSRAGRIINLHPFTTDTLKEILRDFNPSYTAEDLLAALHCIGRGSMVYQLTDG